MYDTLINKIEKKIERHISTLELEMIVKWKERKKYKDDIVLEAVNRAIQNNAKNFRYIDAILTNWENEGIKTYTEILEHDKKYKPQHKRNNVFKVKIKKLTETAKVPTYGSEYAAGADLYADINEDVYIPNGKTAFIHTGISVEIPEGYVGLIFARSGLSCKQGLAPANKVGVIDADYRGEVIVALFNHEDYMDTIDSDYADYKKRHTIKHGDRIAQIAFMPVKQAEFEEIDELNESVRGEGGFGSTGKN